VKKQCGQCEIEPNRHEWATNRRVTSATVVTECVSASYWKPFFLAAGNDSRIHAPPSAGDPVTMKSVRDASWKVHASYGLASEVRSIDDYQVTAVPGRVIDVGQIPSGEFAPV
jgi:hypothetical protein